jgi:ZIP family zinc transporter
MSLARTLLLGLIAGVTIVLGLPVGRMRRPAPKLRVALNAIAVGILLFLVWDVLSAAWEPIDAALGSVHHGSGKFRVAVGYGLLAAAGLSVGLLGLVRYERWMTALPSPRRFGPGAMSATEPLSRTASAHGLGSWSAARRLALLIAVGIGLHNFAEGLGIGQSAASGQISLATLLVVGFSLHNATEGFGIVAPLAADTDRSGGARRPSWRFLLGLAGIAGGPTFIGTWVGHSFTSEPLAVAFLTLAAGSLLGLIAGFITDGIVTAGGA